jgi:hypothetical protein
LALARRSALESREMAPLGMIYSYARVTTLSIEILDLLMQPSRRVEIDPEGLIPPPRSREQALSTAAVVQSKARYSTRARV